MTLSDLIVRWREEAQLLRTHGAEEAAATKERDADELATTLRDVEAEELTLAAAATESGYSVSQLRRRFPGQKRIPRRKLPRKGAVGGPDIKDFLRE